jgi:hypothetical protein
MDGDRYVRRRRAKSTASQTHAELGDENNALIRLANTIESFERDALLGHFIEITDLYERAKRDEFLIGV